MIRDDLVLKKIILEFLMNNDFKKLEILINKLKREGKFFKVKKNLDDIINSFYEKNNFLVGELEIAFDENIELIKNRLPYNFLIQKVKVNRYLIAGGVFRSKNKEFNFSLLNNLKQIFNNG
ncbi:MAG: hypothetical protein NZ866_00590 [Patescibacteria group bacterium]|nr:hypothetical protein [Patescibacteria group bacterium]